MTRNAITQYKTVCLHIIIARATSLPGRDFSYFACRSFRLATVFIFASLARTFDALIDFGCFIIFNYVARNEGGEGRGGISRAKLHWDRRLVVRVVNHFVVIGVGKLCNTITFVFLFHLASSPLLRIRGAGILVRIKFEPLFFDKLLERESLEKKKLFRSMEEDLSKFSFFFVKRCSNVNLSKFALLIVELEVKLRYIRSIIQFLIR